MVIRKVKGASGHGRGCGVVVGFGRRSTVQDQGGGGDLDIIGANGWQRHFTDDPHGLITYDLRCRW